MKRFFVTSLSSLIGFLILLFIVFPLSFGALTRHYIHTALRDWVNNHPGSTYQFVTVNRGIFTSTQKITLGFEGIPLLDTSFKLAYGPIIFEDGFHFGLAIIAKSTTTMNGIPPTTYSGKINFLGGITIDTHTPHPADIINLLKVLFQLNFSLSLDSLDAEFYSNLTTRSTNLKVTVNQIDFENSPYSLKANQLTLSLKNFKETHGDASGLASFSIQGFSYEDGLNHLKIPNFSFSNYEAMGSQLEAFSKLREKINGMTTPTSQVSLKNQADEKAELIKQAISMLLLGINHQTDIQLSATHTSPVSTGTFNLHVTFPGLPDNPTPNEIMKHLQYQTSLGIPSFHLIPTQTSPIDLSLQKLSFTENKETSELYFPSLSLKNKDQTLFSLDALNLKSSTSSGFLSKQQGGTLEIQVEHLCVQDTCMHGFNLSNEIKGLDKNALLDSQGDFLVSVLGSVVFQTIPNEFQVFPLKTLLTQNSEDLLNIHGQLPHGEASLDFEIRTPHLSPQKTLSQNIVAEGVLKAPTQDVLNLLKVNKTNNAPATSPTDTAYTIKDTSNMDLYQLANFIHQTWLSAGFISVQGGSELLIFNFSPEDGISFNHKKFDDLHQAAFYGNIGDFDASLEMLNKPEYLDNPTAQKMKVQIEEIQKTLSEKALISNLPQTTS